MASQSLMQIADFLRNKSIKFEQNIPDRLKCIICSEILKNAKQTACGCKACEWCINDHLKDGDKPCPSKQPDCANSNLKLSRDIQQDNATNKEIANLKIYCPFKNCKESDTIRIMMLHVENCEHREVVCDRCRNKYSFKLKEDHDKNVCEQRTVTCKHCNDKMSYVYQTTVHLDRDNENLCSKFIGDCINDCGVKNVNLKLHLKLCTNKRIECPFHKLQCTVGKISKKSLTAHLQDEADSHSQSLIAEILELKEINKKLTNDVNRLKKFVEEHVTIIGTLTDARIKTDRTIEDLKRRGVGTASSSKEISAIFRNANFVWKIINFESLKSDAEAGTRASVTSDPFYTSEFGYKMCLRIYPAGDGVGRGSHLSVFFALMMGDYDDILTWPFKQKVTLSLLDQENNGAKNHSDTFKPDARSACYQKPVEDCNIASGSPKFIILNNLIPTSIYYKNDTMFIKITVDTIGITKP